MAPNIEYIDLSYDPSNSQESAIKLVTTLFPEWAADTSTIQFIRFKDGITNTVRPPVRWQ
jgi:ethanolamine kinase